MKQVIGLVFVFIILTAAFPLGAQAQTGEKSGLQVDLGLGFTSGIDSGEELGLSNIEESSGATLRFGLTYRLPLMENFFLNPTFQMAFFNEEIDFDGQQFNIDGQTVNLNSLKSSITQINFGVIPTYYFMPATAKFRAYGGLALKLNINSFGEIDVDTQQGNGTSEGPDGKTSLAVGPTVGFDYQLANGMIIPFVLQYDILFAENMGNVFLVSTGVVFHF